MFSYYSIKKSAFSETSLAYIGYAEMPHTDNGGDCKKEETGGNNYHTAFAVPFSLFPK